MEIRKYGKHWAVYEEETLICITLYNELVVRLQVHYPFLKLLYNRHSVVDW